MESEHCMRNSSSKPFFLCCGSAALMIAAALILHSQSSPTPNPDVEKQALTILRMKTVARSLDMYKADIGFYPSAASIAGLSVTLEPDYFEQGKLHEYGTDGWGRPMRYETWSDNPNPKGDQHYVLSSAGRDGKWEQVNIRQYAPRATLTMDDNLVISDNHFLRHPSAEEIKH